jgi:malonyl-CoA O-methyltransferase
MSIDKIQVLRRFNRSASTYHQHAVVQQQMAHQLLQHIPQSVDRICEIGCGTGYLTQLLAAQYPEASIVAIDLASQMVEMAKKNVDHPNIQWIVGDAEQLSHHVSGQFDLIISNATIQWLANPNETMCAWTDLLNADGKLICSTFGQNTFQELVTLFQRIEKELGIQPHPHHVPMQTARFWQQLWEEVGLTSVAVAEDWQQVSYPDCRSFLQSIKATGANYSKANSPMLTRRLLLNVMQQYDRIYRVQSQVYATYHVLYLYGQKNDV